MIIASNVYLLLQLIIAVLIAERLRGTGLRPRQRNLEKGQNIYNISITNSHYSLTVTNVIVVIDD